MLDKQIIRLMTQLFQNYLGKWIVNDDVDPQRANTIECIDVDDAKRIAKFKTEDGQLFNISLFELDNSNGKYEKLKPLFEAPEVKQNLSQFKGSLSERAPKSPKLGDLSKIGRKREKQEVNESLRMTEEETFERIETQRERTQVYEETPVYNDPIKTFISSAIQISRKAGAYSEIPVKINIKLDFDILSVIKSAMSLGASDVEILQHIFDEVTISTKDVKKSVFEELLKSPDDVDIALSEREKTFDKTLNEELGNATSSNSKPHPNDVIYTELS